MLEATSRDNLGGPPFRAVLRGIRAWIRGLRTQKASPSVAERIGRSLLMVPALGVLVIVLRVRARFIGPINVLVETYSGDRFICRPPDLIQMYLWVFGIWEPDLTQFIESRLTEGDGFIDVGANIGYFAALAARRVGPNGRVVAIEARSVFALLGETLRPNPHTANTRRISGAAASERGTLPIYSGPDHNVGLTTTVRSFRSLEFHEIATVEALPIDGLLTNDEVRSARLVKIDVEGGEVGVLAGMKSIIRQCRDDVEILIELSPEWWPGHTRRPIDVLEPFFRAGFHAYEIDNNYWPWRYLWPQSIRRPRRCRRDLTERSACIDLALSRRDEEVL
jgi:FkbM family methyltransferase